MIGTAVLAAPAFAQDQTTAAPQAAATAADAAAEAATDNNEDIIVTGTLIRNPNIEKSSPISVIGAAEIEMKQSNTAEELLRDLPGAAPSIGSAVNNGQGGSSFVDLRGLGINRNLALLDGMRLVPARADGAADLNNIPLALIERVDVLTGGASTTYGADAISGVVNFVTKRNFQGAQLDVSNQITEHGDGHTFRVDLTIGGNFADDAGNAVLSVGYQQADPVYQGARSFSVDNIDSSTGEAGGSGTSIPVRVSIPGVGTRQLNTATGAFNADSSFIPFNFNPQNILQTPFERFNIYGAANYEIADSVEVYAVGMFSRNKSESIVASSGLFGSPFTIPFSNPFLPGPARDQLCAANGLSAAECGAAALATDPNDPAYRTFTSNIFRRFVEGGPRRTVFTTTFFQQKIGVRGNITDSISYDVYGTYGESELLRENKGFGLFSRAQQALLATNPNTCLDTTNNCVPLNIFGPQGSINPDMLAFINAANATDTQKNSLSQIRGVVNGELGSIGDAQPIGFAIGAEYRENSAAREVDALSQIPGEVLGLGGAPATTDNSTDVKEVFGELIAPLIADKPFAHSLTLELGARYSDYNTTGGAFTYKVGGSWEPIESLKIRGNYNRATRSPTIQELYASVVTGLNNSAYDPCQGQATDPTDAETFNPAIGNPIVQQICLAQGAPPSTIGTITAPSGAQINFTQGGNPDLDVEKADTFTVGFVFQPEFAPGLTLTVDYYNIKVKNAITAPTIDDQLRECFGGSTPDTINPAAGAATSADCAEFQRDPLTGGLDGDAATTPGVFLPLSNQGTIKTDGIDWTLAYKHEFDWAVLDFAFNGNWTNSSKFKSKPGSINRECVGFYSVNCGAPGNGTTAFGSVGSIQPEFSWNARTTLGFDNNIDVSLLWRHISSVDVEPLVEEQFLEDFRHIKAYDWFDLTFQFEPTDNMTFTATIQNLFDKQPPIVGSTIGSTSFNSGNTYPSTYDTLGRRFALGAKLRF
ncbi:TonB-dependent receptor [Sphingomonas sp. DBB INV C78]